ncbi:MAG TPA: 4-vinyl reductase [Anaerolineae bacterium]
MLENTILAELTCDASQGALRFKGVRYLLIRPETLASLQASLEAEIGPERAGEILYGSGFTGGQLSGRKYKDIFGLSDRQAVEFMCRMGAEIGWGHFHLVELNVTARHLAVEVAASPFAQYYNSETEAGVCHLIRGVLGGLGSAVFGTAVQAREVRCLALGNELCRFEVLALAADKDIRRSPPV